MIHLQIIRHLHPPCRTLKQTGSHRPGTTSLLYVAGFEKSFFCNEITEWFYWLILSNVCLSIFKNGPCQNIYNSYMPNSLQSETLPAITPVCTQEVQGSWTTRKNLRRRRIINFIIGILFTLSQTSRYKLNPNDPGTERTTKRHSVTIRKTSRGHNRVIKPTRL